MCVCVCVCVCVQNVESMLQTRKELDSPVLDEQPLPTHFSSLHRQYRGRGRMRERGGEEGGRGGRGGEGGMGGGEEEGEREGGERRGRRGSYWRGRGGGGERDSRRERPPPDSK